MKLKKTFIFILLALTLLPLTAQVITVEASSLDERGKIDYTAAPSTISASGNTFHAVTFNPQTSDYIPYCVAGPSGQGRSVITSGRELIEKGYEVYAGINTIFYALGDRSAYDGYVITEGRIVEASNGYVQREMLVFDSAGHASLQYSKLGFTLSINGKEWNWSGHSALGHINKKNGTFSEVPSAYETGRTAGMKLISYFDSAFGTKTNQAEPGVEIVVERSEHTPDAPIIGGIVQGTVIQIITDSSSTPIGKNQFVLYVKNSSTELAEQARNLKIGDKIELKTEELLSAAKPVTKKAYTAVTAQIVIVRNGQIAANRNDSVYGIPANDRDRRSALGIKPDGSVVFLVSEGSNTTGFTWSDVADELIRMGCNTGLMLDGGGGTQMCVSNGTGDTLFNKYVGEGNGRAVQASILCVKRPKVDDGLKSELDRTITMAAGVSQIPDLISALADAAQVKVETTSMSSDYERVIWRIQKAIQDAAIQQFKLTDDTTCIMENGDWMFIKQEKCTVKALKAQFENAISIKSSVGKLLSDESIVSTGCIIQSTGVNLIVVLPGDLNGDGTIDSFDYFLLRRAVVQTYTLNSFQIRAACVISPTHSTPTSTDCLAVKKHIIRTHSLWT